MDSVEFWPGNPLSYTTTRIDVLLNDIVLSTATGFVIKYATKYALVTNWHVLSGFNPADDKCLSKLGAIPNRIKFHVAVSRKRKRKSKFTEEIYFKPMSIALLVADKPIWVDDRQSGRQNDYAVIDLSQYVPELKEKGVSLRSILGGRVTLRRGHVPNKSDGFRPEDLSNFYPPVGAEVFVLGYPKGVSTNGLFPIWKRGSVASEPQGSIQLAGHEYTNAFYIDALTKSGMSGSPVVCIAKSGDYLHTEDGVTIEVKKTDSYVVGVYAGRDGLTNEEYELSLGRVWKIGAVEKLLQHNPARSVTS